MTFTNCFITGEPFDKTVKFYPQVDNCHLYEYRIVGRVYISEFARLVLERNTNINKNILAGMCRYAFELHKNPQLIDTTLINEHRTMFSFYPKSFNEKCDHLLQNYFMTLAEKKIRVSHSTHFWIILWPSLTQQKNSIE